MEPEGRFAEMKDRIQTISNDTFKTLNQRNVQTILCVGFSDVNLFPLMHGMNNIKCPQASEIYQYKNIRVHETFVHFVGPGS
jgi:hypothetical protein